MPVKPRVIVFPASLRAGSYNRKLAIEAAIALEQQGVDPVLLDLRDFPMPMYDGDLEAAQGLPETARKLKEIVRAADGFVIASPEYNGSFPALLKNTIDWISRPENGDRPLAALRGKVAGILSTSPGPGGGRRGLKHLRELLEMIGVTVTAELAIPGASQAFTDDGKLARREDAEALRKFASQYVSKLQKFAAA
jgi:chromate reductase, NAD(P)H dehydrogenase (quinone)